MRSNSVSLGTMKRDAYMDMVKAFSHILNNLNIEKDIEKIVEFIGIKTILYSSTLMAVKAGNDNKVLNKIVIDFEKNFPQWNSNPYISKLKIQKRFYLKALLFSQWNLLKMYAKLHQYILN